MFNFGVLLDCEALNDTCQDLTERLLCKFYENSEGILVAIVSIFSARNVFG